MKFGAGVWPFQWHPPYDAPLRRIAGLGFRATELIAWNRDTLDNYYTPGCIDGLRALMDGEGLAITEFISVIPGMASPEPADRDAAVEHFRRQVEVAVELGTTTVNTVAPTPFEMPVPPLMQLPARQEWTLAVARRRGWDQNWADYVDTVRRFCEICQEAEVLYAVEPHPYRWVRNAASMMRLIDHVGSPALGMNFDPSHLFPSGEMPQMVAYEVGERIFHTHFSDNDGVTNAHWRPGKGKIDWRGVLQALKDVGYDHVLSIELEDVPGVSRPGQESTDALDREYALSKRYLEALCEEVRIKIEE